MTPNASILACGRFRSFTGPFGQRPIQGEGYLVTGEFVYFRARETKVEVEVYRTRTDLGLNDRRLAYFRQEVPYDAGYLPDDWCAQYIVNSIARY